MPHDFQLPFCFDRPHRIRRWRGLVTTTLGWILCWYGWWGLVMMLVIGANVVMVWPAVSIVEPQAFPAGFAALFLLVFLIALPGTVVPLFGPELLEYGRKMRTKNVVTVLAKD